MCRSTKKLLSLILSIVLLIPMVSMNFGYHADASDKIAIGDTITLGKYNGKPIEWICILIDDNGPLMLSKEVLCNKEYDAPGVDATYHTDGWGYIRKRSGSNCWSDSNIRQWLNTSGNVSYTHCPPSYAEEDGFLSNFTANELALVKEVTQKVTVNEWESHRPGYVDGGSRESPDAYDINGLGNLIPDIDNYWYQNVTDRFFLLGQEQLYNGYINLPEVITTGAYYTRIAINLGASYENVGFVDGANMIYSGRNACDSYGIRPAFYINKQGIKEELCYGADRFTYGEDFEITAGTPEATVLKYVSAKYDISNLTITSSDPSVLSIESIVPGQGEKTEIPTEEGTHVGTVNIIGKSEGIAIVSVTTPLETVCSVAVKVIRKESITPGDVDGNGKIEAADARLALRASVGLEKDIVKGTGAYQAADVDGNDKVESADARLILRASVGLEDASKFGKK